jgi:ATP-dependent helicase HepA
MEAIGPPRLELQRYLPPTPLLVSVDLAGRAWSGALPGAHALERLQAPTVGALSARLGPRLETLVEKAGALAVERSGAWRQAALEKARRALGQEQARLEELHRVNPAVPVGEVQAHRARVGAVLKALNQAAPRLDSLRLVLLEPATS